ncbi:hypothetical protein TWF281_006847 [Arthrobotrys megalospora]
MATDILDTSANPEYPSLSPCESEYDTDDDDIPISDIFEFEEMDKEGPPQPFPISNLPASLLAQIMSNLPLSSLLTFLAASKAAYAAFIAYYETSHLDKILTGVLYCTVKDPCMAAYFPPFIGDDEVGAPWWWWGDDKDTERKIGSGVRYIHSLKKLEDGIEEILERARVFERYRFEDRVGRYRKRKWSVEKEESEKGLRTRMLILWAQFHFRVNFETEASLRRRNNTPDLPNHVLHALNPEDLPVDPRLGDHILPAQYDTSQRTFLRLLYALIWPHHEERIYSALANNYCTKRDAKFVEKVQKRVVITLDTRCLLDIVRYKWPRPGESHDKMQETYKSAKERLANWIQVALERYREERVIHGDGISQKMVLEILSLQ